MSFSSVKIEGRRATPDRVYYNGTVINNSTITTQLEDDPELIFQDQRQIPIIVDSADYEVSLQNFSLNGSTKSLPLFIPQIADPFSDVNETIYKVSVNVFDGTNYYSSEQSVIWIPENQTSYTVIPQAGVSTVQLETDYYYCYSYSHMISLINKAFLTAWENATTSGTVVGTQCPFLEFDETTGLFSLNQDANTCLIPYGQTLPPPYNVTSTSISTNTQNYISGEYSFLGWNVCLDNLITNFPVIYFSANRLWSSSGLPLPEVVVNTGLNINLLTGATNDETNIGLIIKTKPTYSNLTLVDPFTNAAITNTSFIRLTQDYKSTGGCWSPVASFVLGTNEIPVRNESSANPVVFGAANVGGNTSSSGSFQKVLAEVPINAVTGDLWRGWILYEPLIPTYSSLDPSNTGVQDIDVTVYWRNRLTNSLIPVRIPNQATMSFRLLFKRKLVF